MGKRLMTLSDLYNYYSAQGKTQNFSCQDDGDTIVVQVDGKLNFSKSDSKDGLYLTRVQMNFVGDNLNQSRIEMKAQKNALPSSHYRPLLAYIHDVDGEPYFYGHNMHQDENGEIVYDEIPVGVIAEEAHIEHDDEYDMDYAVANGYIWEEYSQAAYILERDQKCDVSVELSIRSLSYSAKDGILILDDFYYSGCTILGCDDEGNKVNPAMPGSNITLADFSVDKNSAVDSDKLIQTLEKINELLTKFEITTTTKGGDTVTKFEELLAKYEKSIEDITFEYESLSDEELETAFADAFAEGETTDEPEVEETVEEMVDEPIEEVEETEENADTDEVVVEEESLQCSVKIGEHVKEFSVSMNAKLEALSQLVNDTYADDMTWYCVEAFDDDKQVIMIDCWSGRAYRQSYKVKEDVFSLKGDRVEVYSTWMTADEQKAFDKMKADFAELTTTYEETKAQLDKHESEPAKMEILSSDDYKQIADTDEFKEFSKKESHFDMSIEEVKSTADDMLLEFAKKGNLTFSIDVEKKLVGKKSLPATVSKTKSRYGNLFKNI